MTAYAIASISISPSDRQKHDEEFMPAVMKAHQAYSVETLVRTDDTELLVGTFNSSRLVILQFLDTAHAHAWWNSPEMKHALGIGKTCTDHITVILAPGYEMIPQEDNTKSETVDGPTVEAPASE